MERNRDKSTVEQLLEELKVTLAEVRSARHSLAIKRGLRHSAQQKTVLEADAPTKPEGNKV
jgi:hypothetical protein